MNFQNKLDKIVNKNNSRLCVGLDPDPTQHLQGDPLQGGLSSFFEFNKRIIDETHGLVCAYKPNIAFYEANGIEGLGELKKTLDYIKSTYSEIPIILDAKRADIENTAKMYARSVFGYWGADATTVYPHLGFDSIEPFLSYKDKYTFLLVKTSNPDSDTFQNLKTEKGPYYLAVAKEIKKWEKDNIGIFVGATYPDEIRKLRELFPNTIFLSAGTGAQGADLKASVEAGVDKDKGGVIFNASRSIIFAKNPRQAAQNLRDEINKYR